MALSAEQIAAYEQSRNLTNKAFRAACYAPFTSLYFNTNGDVIACCKNTSYVLGNVAEQRLGEIWRGKRANALRKAMRDYKLGAGCEFCDWQIQAGQFDQVYATQFDRFPVSEGAEWPSMLEFTLSNTCNLACIMCYGVLSSTIRAHREKLPPLPKVYDDRFFADLRPFLSHLRLAKFFGGEPFLSQENYRVWDMMIEDGIRIPCHITTNGTVYDARVQRILDAFPCHIAVSFDGATKETVESIRVNAKFEKLHENLEHFLAHVRRDPEATLSMTYCLMRQNWHELAAYLRFAEERGVLVFINTVVDPRHCSLYTLEPSEILEIADTMEREGAGTEALPLNGGTWRSAIESLRKNADESKHDLIDDIKKRYASNNPITKAWDKVNAGDFEGALPIAAKVPPTDGRYFDRLMVEGHALRRMGRLEDSERVLAEAAKLYRRSPLPSIEMAWIHMARNHYDAAIETASQAVELGREQPNPAALVVLAHAQAHAGRGEQAQEAVDRAIALAPGDAGMVVEKGWVHVICGQPDQARAVAERAAELQPDHGGLASLQGYLASEAAGRG